MSGSVLCWLGNSAQRDALQNRMWATFVNPFGPIEQKRVFFLQFWLKRKREDFAQGWWWKVPVQAQHDFQDTFTYTKTQKSTTLGYHSQWMNCHRPIHILGVYMTFCYKMLLKHSILCVTDSGQGHAKCKHTLKHSNQRYRSDTDEILFLYIVWGP